MANAAENMETLRKNYRITFAYSSSEPRPKVSLVFSFAVKGCEKSWLCAAHEGNSKLTQITMQKVTQRRQYKVVKVVKRY
jgi:hypothetical protein